MKSYILIIALFTLTSFVSIQHTFWQGFAIVRVSSTMRYSLSKIILAPNKNKATVLFTRWILKEYPTATWNKNDTNEYKILRFSENEILK